MKNYIKAAVVLLLIVIFFGASMFALNLYTGPIIEANNAGAALAPLLAVMPEGSSFDGDALITDTLKDLPASYDFRAKDPSYLGSYIGKDSALADVGLVSGATFSSTAFKGAVEEAMGVLITNNMIAAGVKSDAQILEELIATVAPGFTKTTELTPSGNIEKALKATNDIGFAYIMKDCEASFLAVVNATGVCKLYDVEGNDVTDAHAALVTEAVAHAAANQKSYKDAVETKFGRMVEGATDMTTLELDTFGTIAYAASFKVGDTTYYGFYSRSIGFEQMDVYVVLDANGAIAKVDAKAIFFETEYFPVDDNVNEKEYKDSFTGLTPDSFTGDNAMIAGATMTSNAMKQSVTDAFDAFKNLDK